MTLFEVFENKERNKSARERRPTIWDAAYGAAFATMIHAGELPISPRHAARLCADARAKANAAVEAIEVHEAGLGSDE